MKILPNESFGFQRITVERGFRTVDVVSILTKKRERFTSVEVHADTERAPEPPRVYTKIKLIYRIGGQVARKSIEDAIRLSIEKYCSVEGMLKKTADVTYEIEMV